MAPTWDDLGPLLRGHDIRRDAAWAVLERHHDFVFGAIRHTLSRSRDLVDRYDGSLDRATDEAFQWAVEHLIARVVEPPPGLPVAERQDGTPGSAASWFRTVCSNLAKDWAKAQRRRHRREEALDEARQAAEPEPEPDPWDEAALQKLQRLLARPDRAGVPDTQVLAYLCLYRPDVVDRAAVERAAAYVPSAGSRSGPTGLVRSVDATWAHLQAWREVHGDDPCTTEGRAALAWVLRSDDPGPMDTWRARDRAAAKTAAETVGKWANRCADLLTLPRRG